MVNIEDTVTGCCMNYTYKYSTTEYYLAFRYTYRIRAGSFRSTRKTSYPAYYIHCNTEVNLHTLETSIIEYANENNSLPCVYNYAVTASAFSPNGKDRNKNV